MSAQDFIDFVTKTGGTGFQLEIESIIREAYTSSTMAAILEARMYSGDPLYISQTFGDTGYNPDSLTITIDLSLENSKQFIDQYGALASNSATFSLIHELLHAAFHPDIGDPDATSALDGTGPLRGGIVDLQNIITTELGYESIRTGYFSQNSPIFTNYNEVLQATISGFGHIVQNSIIHEGDIVISNNEINLVLGTDSFLQAYGGSNVDIIFGTKHGDILHGNNGNDILVGGEGSDEFHGGSGNDLLIGGQGYDYYDGGTGDDTIFAASDDIQDENNLLYGGRGFDVLYFAEPNIDTYEGINSFDSDSSDIVLDLREINDKKIEAVYLGVGADSIITDNTFTKVIAGNDGDDTLTISRVKAVTGAPQIFWGGDGADSVKIEIGDSERPAGVLVIENLNITEQNFHLIDLDMLGQGSGFDWSQIDVVLINPDDNDTVFINDQLLEVVPTEVGPSLIERYGPIGPEILGDSAINYGPVYTFGSSFLGGSVNYPIFAASGFQAFIEFWDYDGVLNLQGVDPSLLMEIAIGASETISSTDPSTGEVTSWTTAPHLFLNPWFGFPDGTAAFAERTETFDIENVVFSKSEGLGSWFIVGAKLDGTSIVSLEDSGLQQRMFNALLGDESSWVSNQSTFSGFTFIMPEPGDPGNGLPRGGSYGYAGAVSNLIGEEGVRRITYFNTATDTVVIDGNAIDGSNVTSGVTIAEIAGSVVINYGEDDYVVLRGVALADWQAGAVAQIQGSNASEALTGMSGADVFAGGGGNDTITAGAGDDRINYASGNDVILGHVNNLGNDTLDLRRFSANDVRFSVNGPDVLITTADGTITLGSQTSYDIGHLRSNIETILFSDGSLTEVDIRIRAVADQATSADDLVIGTAFADVINGAAGNDTLAGGAGDDTFLFTSGNDVIAGNKANAGADTLDLSQYDAEDVHFNLSGTDVLIATADGTIRLEMQVRYDLGDAFSNIETIQFNNGTLNEADIRTRAVADQMTSGNDNIIGTAFNDILSGGAGNDTLNGGAGADTFMFSSGNDVILGHVNNAGADTLNLSQYAAADVRFSLSGSDIVITTADGTIRLGSQLSYDLGNARSNIETIVFSDGTINEAAIRTRGVADQATAGNDIIVGTAYADILNGGTGNDTMTGGAGADTFVFGVGVGKDRVTDFALASDHIRFSGHVFSDLTITQSGANTLVAFGVDDVMTLVNITASSVTAAQFDFV